MYVVKVDMSPLTHVSDIVAAMNPLLHLLGVVYPFDEVIVATRVPDTDPNAVHPNGVCMYV